MTPDRIPHPTNDIELPVQPRREFLLAMAMASSAGFFSTGANAAPEAGPKNDFPPDWDFLVGRWQVRNRRLKQRLSGSTLWEEFGSTLVNWSVLGGQGNVGDNVFEQPGGGSYRGLSLRTFDPETRQWLSWWLDARTPALIASPTRGVFKNGVGTLIGDDMFDGRAVKVRSEWSQITATSERRIPSH